MPLVTITCSRKFYPRDDFTGLTEPPAQAFVVKLAKTLPGLVVESAFWLGLSSNTPADYVQVDIKKFHHEAVNASNIRIRVELDKKYPSQQVAMEASSKFVDLLCQHIKPHRRDLGDDEPQLEVEIAWVPSHTVIF
jgi:hypothetical protein